MSVSLATREQSWYNRMRYNPACIVIPGQFDGLPGCSRAIFEAKWVSLDALSVGMGIWHIWVGQV
jgi:hypothetical protein